MDISLKQFEHLLALDRHRHYGRAAETLGISQPALSRSILAVERRLGMTLFHRSRNRVEPTGAGRLLLRHARRVAAMSADLETELDELQGRAERRLSVICGHYAAELTVPRALSALMRQWPDVQINMEVADWTHGIQLLEAGTCDLAVIELSASSQQIELHAELLNDQQVFLVVRPDHPLAQQRKPQLEDLLAWPWASSRIPPRGAQQFGPGPIAAGDFDDQTGYLVPKIVASSLSTSLRLVMENDIVGITPLSVAEPHLRNGRLKLVRYAASWMRLNYGFVHEEGKPLAAAARAFMGHIRDAEAAERGRDRRLRAEFGVDDW